MPVLVTNNGWGELSIPITAESTTLLVSGSQGDRFPSAVQDATWFYATIVDSENNLEIVKVVARSGDTFTIVRGADGTTARAFPEGSRIELRPTAALFNDKASKDELKSELASLEAKLKEADNNDFKALEKQITDLGDKTVTKDELKDELDKVKEDAEDGYLSQADAKKTYLPLEGGTLTGGLTVNPSTSSGIVLKSDTGASLVVQGGDIQVSSSGGKGGSITASGTVRGDVIRSTSDERRKKDIQPLSASEGAVLCAALQPVHFRWKKDGTPDIGLIAQDVRPVLPEVVGEDADGTLSINYPALVAICIAAIHDLQSQVEELKCRLR